MPAITVTLATGHLYNLRQLFQADPSNPPTGVSALKGDTTAGAYFPPSWAEVTIQSSPSANNAGTIREGGPGIPTDGTAGTEIAPGQSYTLLHAARATIALGNTYIAVTASTVVNIDVH